MSRRRSKRNSVEADMESDEENMNVNAKHSADDDEEDDDDDNHHALMFSSQAPEMSQEIPEVKESERTNLMKLSESQRNKVITDLTRLVLFKALAGEKIDRASTIKEAGITDSRISSAAFDEVNLRMKNVFGFELRRIPKFMEKMKGMGKKYKDRYYVTNPVLDQDEQGEHSKKIQSVHETSAIEKGLLMVVLALAYCKGEPRHDGSRWIHDKDLYTLLHRIDDNIPAEPPTQGSKRKASSTQASSSSGRFVGGVAAAQTPNVDALLNKFVHRDYLIKEKATPTQLEANNDVEENDHFYTMGPRAALEVGRRQVIYFCAEILGEEPDVTMLQELENDPDEEMAE